MSNWTYEYSPYTSQDGEEIPAYEVIGEEKICDINENLPIDKQEEYARLIAAAPELLEAAIMAFNLLVSKKIESDVDQLLKKTIVIGALCIAIDSTGGNK